MGYRTGLWTAWRVADLIQRECGVQYSTVQAWRVLRDRWERLGPSDRRRLAEIVRKGRQVSERDKADLRRIVRRLELLDAGRQLVPIVGRRRRRRR